MRPRLRTLEPRIKPLESRQSQARILTRGHAASRGYDYRWQRYREHWLRAHPLCGDREDGPSAEHSHCAAQGRVTPATDVDHIRRVINGQNDPTFWLTSNHQSLCHECHSVKTQSEQAEAV